MRRLALALLLCLCPAIAEAADGAQFQALGYSPDSHYFAFEQFGIQDGSGFPYVDVFIIDTEKNEWVKGSPIRELLKQETARLGAARKKALSRAAPLLKARGITEPAELLAALPATQLFAGREKVSFDRFYNSMAGGAAEKPSDNNARTELTLTATDVPMPESCKGFAGQVRGFTLTVNRVQPPTPAVIHSDASLPDSRGCPEGYDIAAVYGPMGFSKTRRLVALIAVYARGFEGMNRRYIAVPFADP